MVQQSFLESIPEVSNPILQLIPNNNKYKHLETRLQELGETNREIQEQYNIENSILQKLKLVIKSKFLKTEIKTLDELFDKQLTNINSISSCLNSINQEARKELEKQETYYEDISINFETRIKSIGEKRENLTSLVKQVKSYQLEFSSMEKSDSEYFSKEIELKKLERELQDKKHNYIINNDCVIDMGQEKNSLEITERFLRNSVYVCERVGNKISNIQRHLENTKTVYRNLRQQHKTISSLSEAIKLIINCSSQIQTTVSNDLIKINNLLTEPNQINEFYKNPVLKDTVAHLETANNYNDQEIDRIIQDYLSS